VLRVLIAVAIALPLYELLRYRVLRRVREYIDEIVPAFSLAPYFSSACGSPAPPSAPSIGR
jgi:hypothetical protein